MASFIKSVVLTSTPLALVSGMLAGLANGETAATNPAAGATQATTAPATGPATHAATLPILLIPASREPYVTNGIRQ